MLVFEDVYAGHLGRQPNVTGDRHGHVVRTDMEFPYDAFVIKNARGDVSGKSDVYKNRNSSLSVPFRSLCDWSNISSCGNIVSSDTIDPFRYWSVRTIEVAVNLYFGCCGWVPPIDVDIDIDSPTYCSRRLFWRRRRYRARHEFRVRLQSVCSTFECA